MDALGTILFVAIMGSMVGLPILWVRFRWNKENFQF